jgi:regulatory protein
MMSGNLRYAEPMSKPRPPKRISKSSLENAALFYLERFSASSETLRRVLLRRVERSSRALGDDPAEGIALVADLIGRYQASGLLDDQRYAEGKSRSLLRRGCSPRAIRQDLARRGVAAETIETAIAGLEQDFTDGESSLDLNAAQAYARRRRLGPNRQAELRAAFRDRDLAAMGRAGFSWEIARQVIDGEDGE